jgi:nucleoside phosphorylase
MAQHQRAGRPDLIVAALAQECGLFAPGPGGAPSGLPAWDWEGGAAVVALSGMGPAAARQAAEPLINRCRPELLVSMGFGGALTPGLAAGDVVLGETFWHYDPDTRTYRRRPAPPARDR